MTKEELKEKIIETIVGETGQKWYVCEEAANRIVPLIDSWAAEIIGKKRKTGYKYDNNDLRQATNRLVETQRRRAGLPEK